MKTAIVMAMTLALALLVGCKMSERGGSARLDEGFRILAPAMETSVKQGAVQTVSISLHRDARFMQDVKLRVKAAKGISVEPTSVTIQASDKPEVQLVITADKEAAIGEYPITVNGTPKHGEPTSLEFMVKVVAP